MEEREGCYSFVLSRAPHETNTYYKTFYMKALPVWYTINVKIHWVITEKQFKQANWIPRKSPTKPGTVQFVTSNSEIEIVKFVTNKLFIAP
jgi:hypothetical protein